MASEWIPVEERLPPDNVAVLVNHEATGVEMAFRQGGQWGISWTNHMHSGCAYTHWMPLPEPPVCKSIEERIRDHVCDTLGVPRGQVAEPVGEEVIGLVPPPEPPGVK